VLTSEGMWITEVARLRPTEVAGACGRPDTTAIADALTSSGATVLIIENTHTRAGGTVLSADATAELCRAASERSARIHLDGARLINAAAAHNVPLAELAAPADTVALSLNKGLCAPIGALLAGTRTVITEARDHAWRLGGGTVHKAGILAAAGVVALETMCSRVKEDHRRARDLGERLRRIPEIRLDPEEVETNIVLVDVSGTRLEADACSDALAKRGIRVLVRDERRIRLVTHRLISEAHVVRAAEAFEAVAARSHARRQRGG
jgi:threonine aldolase